MRKRDGTRYDVMPPCMHIMRMTGDRYRITLVACWAGSAGKLIESQGVHRRARDFRDDVIFVNKPWIAITIEERPKDVQPVAIRPASIFTGYTGIILYWWLAVHGTEIRDNKSVWILDQLTFTTDWLQLVDHRQRFMQRRVFNNSTSLIMERKPWPGTLTLSELGQSKHIIKILISFLSR